MFIRELKGIPQVFNLKSSSLRLLPYEVKEISSKEVNDEIKKRAEKGYVLLIEEPAPKKINTKEETN